MTVHSKVKVYMGHVQKCFNSSLLSNATPRKSCMYSIHMTMWVIVIVTRCIILWAGQNAEWELQTNLIVTRLYRY